MRIPTIIPRCPEPVPYLTTHQMREVDRLMIEEYQIQLIQMMENAGRHLAALARERFLGGNPQHKRAVVWPVQVEMGAVPWSALAGCTTRAQMSRFISLHLRINSRLYPRTNWISYTRWEST